MDIDALTIMRVVGLINFFAVIGLVLLFIFRRKGFWVAIKALLVGLGVLGLALFGLRRLASLGGKLRGLH